MRKAFLCMLLLAALTITVSCGRGGSPAPGFGQEDLSLSIDGAGYGLKTNIETVLAALGPEYEYSEAISCDYDGLDKTYIYDVAEFYTFPLPEGDLVNEIYTQNAAVSTSKGIAVGAAKEDVLAAYGEDCEDTGYQLIYRFPEAGSLCFDMENGVVTAIYITTQSV